MVFSCCKPSLEDITNAVPIAEPVPSLPVPSPPVLSLPMADPMTNDGKPTDLGRNTNSCVKTHRRYQREAQHDQTIRLRVHMSEQCCIGHGVREEVAPRVHTVSMKRSATIADVKDEVMRSFRPAPPSLTPELMRESVRMDVIGSKATLRNRGRGPYGTTEQHTYHVMENGTQYKISMGNELPWPFAEVHGNPTKVQARLEIDGRHMGSFVYAPGRTCEPLERPAFDGAAKKFTFYTVRSVLAARARLGNPASAAVASEATKAVAASGIDPHNPMTGLIKCTFTPEKVRFDPADFRHVPAGRQKIVLRGSTSSSSLDSAMTLAELGIQDGAELSMQPSITQDDFERNHHPGLRITVQTVTGKRVFLPVEAHDTIDTLKELIWERERIPADQQIILFAGKELRAGRTLGEYNIPEGSTVHLVFRLRGGGARPEDEDTDTAGAPQGTIMGGTTLQGHSDQTFHEAHLRELDHRNQVVLYARLVGSPDEAAEVEARLRLGSTTSLKSACPPAPPL